MRKIRALAHFSRIEVLHIERFPNLSIALQDPLVTIDGFYLIPLRCNIIEYIDRYSPASLRGIRCGIYKPRLGKAYPLL